MRRPWQRIGTSALLALLAVGCSAGGSPLPSQAPSPSINTLAPSRPPANGTTGGPSELIWTSSPWVTLGTPLDVAVASDGRVYVRDASQARITTLDADGNIVGGWGSAGSEDGQFEFLDQEDPHAVTFGGMAILDDVVFVADKSRVQMFDLDGTYLGAWGSRGRKPGQILKAQHVAAGYDGNIYLVDVILKNVQSFSPDGKLIDSWSIPVKNIRYPSVLCVTPKGEIVLADERGDVPEGQPGVVIYKFSSAGDVLDSWDTTFSGTTGAACSADGRIYLSDDGARQVQAFDSHGKPLFSFGGTPGSEPSGAVALSGDDIVVTDTDAGTVSKFRLTE